MSYQITDPNDIFLFFEVIERAQANSVIDIGAFLCRIGAVSRNVKDKAIPAKTRLDCIAPDSIPMFPVYSTIYNDISEELPDSDYELAIMLRPDGVYDREMISGIASWIKEHAGFLLTDKATFSQNEIMKKNKSVQTLAADKNEYCLISF